MRSQEPERVGRILEAIQSISDEAKRALSDPELSRDALISGLSGLIDENHAHLIALGVSHPVLEQIREITAAKPYGLHTKLTGAGGGGCAVTLIPDGKNPVFLRCSNRAELISRTGFRDSSTSALLTALREAGFEPYLTSVGGSGLGVLPSSASGEGQWAGFSEKSAGEFGPWVEGRGRWLFV